MQHTSIPFTLAFGPQGCMAEVKGRVVAVWRHAELPRLFWGLTFLSLSLITQQMYREIKEQGYTGSSTAVGRFVAPLRAHKGKARSFKSVKPELATMVNPEEVKKKRPPTALQVAHWMTFK